MNGLRNIALAMACMAGSLGSIGCQGEGQHYQNLVDPCAFQRYASTARQEAITSFAPQVQNGRILDQTIFNYHFVAGTDTLHPMGMKRLDELVQRRPQPDGRIFLATAHDIAFDMAKANEFGDARRDLDAKRCQAIQKYLAAVTAGRPMPFEVLVHDPAEPSMSGMAMRNAINIQRNSFTGVMVPGGGSGGGGAGAGGGGAGGGGTGGGGTGTGTGTGGGTGTGTGTGTGVGPGM